MGATGGGVTVAWTGASQASTVAVFRHSRVGSTSKTGEAVDDSDLADSVAKMIAGDLVTYAPIEVEVPWDKSEFTGLPIYETGTFTVGNIVGANGNIGRITGAAFVLSKSISDIANNERIMATYVFQPTGAWTWDYTSGA